MFCSNCGKKLADGSKFCPSCGTKIGVILNRQDNNEDDDKFADLDDYLNEEDDDDYEYDELINDILKKTFDEDEEDDDSEEEEDDEEVDNDNNKAFSNSVSNMRLNIECAAWETSSDDIMNTVGSKLFLAAESFFVNMHYDKSIEKFLEYIKINDILLPRYRIAQSYVGLASQQAEHNNYKIDFLNNIENALNTINDMRPTKIESKFKLSVLKGDAFGLQADYFSFMKNVSMGDGKDEEKSKINSTQDTINSYKEALRYAENKLKIIDINSIKLRLLFNIGYRYFELSNFNEAIKYFNQCISTAGTIENYKTVEGKFINQSIYSCIWCYKLIKDYKNTAIMLSRFLKINQDEDIDEDFLKLKTALIEEGYGDYFK